jgi:hypothetical protein
LDDVPALLPQRWNENHHRLGCQVEGRISVDGDIVWRDNEFVGCRLECGVSAEVVYVRAANFDGLGLDAAVVVKRETPQISL